MSQKTACIVAAVCLYLAVTFVYAPVISDHPFAYDEADYMWAGKQGFWANYTDQNGISFPEFVRKGLELSRNLGERQPFSEYIRSTGDIDFYRHFHGPTYAYWLSLLQYAGVQRENIFRGGSLLIHFATATLILFGVWTVFPSLPPITALLACALFVFNRSALMAADSITQHVLFTFLCVAALLACSQFLRTLDARWFYTTLALIAWSLCTVETSILLLGALGLTMLAEHRRVREKWPTLKAFGALLLRGAGVFVLAILVCWPMGVLKLAVAKGFLTLAYFALSRKTYSPLSPIDLWAQEFRVSPWEFGLLAAGVIAALVLWRRFPQRRELLPWLAFIALFVLVMLKISIDRPYYYAPLTAAAAVTTAIAMGILWKSWPLAGRAALLLAVAVSCAGITVAYREVLRDAKAATPVESVVLQAVANQPDAVGGQLYLPYQLVPMLHFYRPDIKTVGYDSDFPLARLADGIRSREAAGIMFCETAFCDALERRVPGFAAQKTPLEGLGPNGQAFYLVRVHRQA